MSNLDQDETEGAIPDAGGASAQPAAAGEGWGTPISADDNTPAIPDQQSEGDASQQPQQPQQGAVPKIVSYLTGQGAAPQEELKAAAAHSGGEADDANLLAVHQAMQRGGPAAAWAMVQANRQAYNAKQTFARAALNGIDGKAGDLAAAAQAASQASQHLLDGSSVTFHPDGDGVTAAVKTPGSAAMQRIKLKTEQFNQWLNSGKDSQFDKVIEEGGTPRVLTQIARGPGEPLAPTAARLASPGPSEAVRAGHAIVRDPTDANQPPLPGTHDANGHYIGPPVRDKTNYGPELEARSRAVYPGAGQEAERQNWMLTQENVEEERANKLGVADAGNKARERIAGIQAGGKVAAAKEGGSARVQSQQIRSDTMKDVEGSRHGDRQAKLLQQAKLHADQLAATARNADERNRVSMFRAEVMDPSGTMRPAGEVEKIAKKYRLPGFDQSGQPATQVQQPTPQPSQPQPSQPSQPQPQGSNAGKKFFNGRWYTRQEYKDEFGK